MPLKCSQCCRVFTIKGNLTRHLRVVHNVEVERGDIAPGDFDKYHYKCLEGCNISFKYNRELRKHLRLKHEHELVELNLEFPNSEEFSKWLHNEEENNHVQYVHLTALKRKITGTVTYYLECSWTGKRSCVDETVRKRRSRKSPGKLNRGCTSQIIVNKTHDGTYNVNYFKSHYGHELAPEHLKLSKQDRGSVASKLLLGMPISTVLNSAKNTPGKRINRLGRKDILNIRKSFNIDVKDGGDAIDLGLFLEECGGQQYNPVLYCNIHEFPKNEEICLMLMSEYQAEMLSDAGSNIIALNSVTLKNCDFELITLFVIGKSWESFPGACMFTNKVDYAIYELFFMKIRERLGVVTPLMLFTNCDDFYYEAWKNVMGVVSHSLYTPCQVVIDWKLNLNLIVCAETAVTRIKRNWVYDTLSSMTSTEEESDFTEYFNSTLKILEEDQDFGDFYQYFTKTFKDPKKWARCYKLGLDLPIKQLEILSDVLKQYLNEEVETRFDKIFHSLIRFLRDETVNSMLQTHKNRAFFTEQNDLRHRVAFDNHLTGTHLGDSLWNVTSPDGITHLVQKILEKKCCNLICTNCRICLHCFSCSCVDFFVSNAMCVHIHFVWLTYLQFIDAEGSDGFPGEEEIIIQVDEEQQADVDNVEMLRGAIVQRTSILCEKVAGLENAEVLKVIFDTLGQLCELREEERVEEDSIGDHAYL